ncbi:MAG TPA: FkbM family methyltransferase [Capillimicrobium sp.]|nr:FkbM family methyltransferase [Capillimicrobium sp.]
MRLPDLRPVDRLLTARAQARMWRFARRAHAAPRFVPGTIELGDLRIHYRDLLSLYVEYKDIFAGRIYDFEATRPAPRVIDGGSHIGVSVLRTKLCHPQARVVCLEPEPASREVLERNIADNGLTGVEILPYALTGEDGQRGFVPDGTDGGKVVESEGDYAVPTVRLSTLLDEPVDFLKLNIEGFELPVLLECRSRLRAVEQMVVEYHGWPGGEQRLGEILTLLDEAGFRYLVNHLDYATNPAVRPPFRLPDGSPWFALIYARRADQPSSSR